MIVRKSLRRLSVVIKTRWDWLVSKSVGSRDLWRIYRIFSNKNKSLIAPLFNGSEVLASAASKAELFAKQFSFNCILDDTVHVLSEIQPRTGVNLSSLYITSKMVGDVKSLDSAESTGYDEIPVVVLQICSPSSAGFLENESKESRFPFCWMPFS